MSLEWFPFKFKAFLIDTMPLNTEGKGAYLLLMLRYYDQGKPLPDDDTQLAAICGLPMDVWSRYRPALVQYFQIESGLWRHTFIDDELATARDKMEQKKAAGKASAAARKRNGRSTGAAAAVQTSDRTAVGTFAATDVATGVGTIVEADFGPSRPKKAVEAGQPTPEHQSGNESSTNVPTVVATDVRTSVLHTLHKNTVEEEGANAPSPAGLDLIGSLIDPAFQPKREVLAEAINADGVTGEELAAWLDDWRDRCETAGTRSTDWHAAWGREYHRRMIERAKAKPKPRVSVSKRRLEKIPDGWVPGESHHKIADGRGLNIIACLESFSDYLLNKRPDWKDIDAAFRNWLKSPHRTEFKRNGQAPQRRAPAPGGSILDAGARFEQRLDAAAGRAPAQDQPDGDAVVLGLPED
jgi:uncharacterized protein YdaU (DUF1376 family)